MRSWLAGLVLISSASIFVGCSGDASSPDVADNSEDGIASSYGVRAHKYDGFFDGSNEAEYTFLNALPEVTAFINEQAKANGAGFTVTESELALNGIAEGIYYALNDDLLSALDGYQFFGIDTLVDNQAAIMPYLHPSVVALLGTDHVKASTNEKGQTVHTLTNLTLAQGLYANAAMFAYSKSQAAKDLAKAGHPMSTLPEVGQFFWTTIYYNAGAGYGHSALVSHGYAFYKTPWTKADDASQYGGNAEYNALWRTASLALLNHDVYHDDGKRDAIAPHDFGAEGTTTSTAIATSNDDLTNGVTKTVTVTSFGAVSTLGVHVDLDQSYAGDEISISVTSGSDGVVAGYGSLTFTDASGDGTFAFSGPYGMGAAQTWTVTLGAVSGAQIKDLSLVVGY
jgi:hypothetical protein